MRHNATATVIRQVAAHASCGVCGHHFGVQDITLVGRRDNVFAMRVQCRECRTKALLFAIVNEGRAQSVHTDLAPEDWERFKDSAPISIDDVIGIHEYIQSYDGDFTDILEEPLAGE